MARLFDSFRRGADEVGNLFAGVLDAFFRRPAEAVIAAGGVAEVVGEKWQHGLDDARVALRGGVVIEIDRQLHGE
jgi:hypothetical protein